jgi:hypothetical protein
MASLDPLRIAELARLADDASNLTWNHQVLLTIQQDGSDDAFRLASAFRYPNNDHRPGEKGHFGPTFVIADGGEAQPLTLKDTPGETCEIWEAVVVAATEPRVLATLHDLLFERRKCKHVGRHGRAAADAYVAYAQTAGSTLAEVDSIRRAVELSKLMKNDDLRTEAMLVALGIVARTLEEIDDPKPGVSLRLLDVLVTHDCEAPEVDQLLGLARAAYPAAWIAAQILEMQRRRTKDTGRLQALNREEVQAHLDDAKRSNSMSRIIHLETAARIARERGVTDLGDEAIRALQNTNIEEIPLQRFTTELEIPQNRVNAQVEHLLSHATTWLDAAMRIVGAGPPSGDFDTNKRNAENHDKEFSLSGVLPPKMLGGDRIPRYEPTTDHERADARITELEVLALTYTTSVVFGEALDQAGERFGIPDADGIIDAFEHLSRGTCLAIARALHRYYDGDPEAAVYTALPLIERLCRNLLLALDEPIFRTQQTTTVGQYPGLGSLLENLRIYLDPSWYRYLKAMLSNPMGLNLRNNALHGYVIDVSASTAVAVLIALLYLAAGRAAPKMTQAPSPEDTPAS